jgi:adenylate cyclase
VIDRYNPTHHHAHTFLYGQDPGIFALSYDTLILWLLGYPTQAYARSQAVLHLIQEDSQAYNRCFALLFTARLHQSCRAWHLTSARAEEAIVLATQHRFVQWVAQGMLMRGWALGEQGQHEAGIAHLRQGLTVWQETGAKASTSYFLYLLADVYEKWGQGGTGLSILGDALLLVDTTGERFYESELYRLKGALLLQQSLGNQVEAETCFQQAITIAQSQQAKSWELRAATSLARLWHQQGKHQEAYDLLAPLYQWFTEGFDTADLKDAKALLDELT